MTKGQKAMSYAVMFPVAEHGGDRTKIKLPEVTCKPHSKLLSQARKILQFKSDRQADVLSGSKPLNEAFGFCSNSQQSALNPAFSLDASSQKR